MTAEDRPILLVEDDPDIRVMLSEILAMEQYHFVEAENGREALDRIQAGLDPALILLDLFMPEMNGFEFLDEYLKGGGGKSPVIIMTAGSPQAPEVQAAAARAQGLIRKPLDLENFLKVLSDHLNG